MGAAKSISNDNVSLYVEAVGKFLKRRNQEGIPPRWTLVEELKKLVELRQTLGVSSITPAPFRLLTATLDDGWGLGIEIIHHACDVLGVHYTFLGLMKSAQDITRSCEIEKPDAVGVTVLQEDTIEELLLLRRLITAETQIFAGGFGIRNLTPVAGITVFKDIVSFMSYLIRKDK